jgi:putative DNA primase/helicase
MTPFQDILDDIEHGTQTGTSVANTKSEAILTRLSDISPQPISWLWPGRIALGKLTLITGDPGLGKSLLTAAIAATVSKGYVWPLGDEAAPIGDAILLSAEDTIRPRLDAAEADCNRIHILQAIRGVDADGNPTERIFSLKRDIAVLKDLLPTLPDCRVIFIDPISAYLEGADSHNNTDVRGLLAPLAKLAADHGIASVVPWVR